MQLEWNRVRPFFAEHGCVVFDCPEIGWYRESWGAIEAAGLVGGRESGEAGLDLTVVRLRALCLLGMYLGMYQAAGQYSELGGYFTEHENFPSYLQSLNIEMEDVWELARAMDILETDCSTYWDDEEMDDTMLCDIAMDIARDENSAIYEALTRHYGGTQGLFVSLWNSRLFPDEIAPVDDVVNSMHPGDGKCEVWAYVEEGMMNWSWA